MGTAYLVRETKESRAVAEKLSKFGRPGAIIFLTKEEFQAFRKDWVEVEVPDPPVPAVKPKLIVPDPPRQDTAPESPVS